MKFLFQPQGGCKGSTEFNREHTLERWAEANEAALRAARRLPRVDKSRTLVVGHSEGGLVACRVARDLPGVVTHVSTVAGGGPSQLYDLIALARQGRLFEEVSSDPHHRFGGDETPGCEVTRGDTNSGRKKWADGVHDAPKH